LDSHNVEASGGVSDSLICVSAEGPEVETVEIDPVWCPRSGGVSREGAVIANVLKGLQHVDERFLLRE
jgi:hypothetical protein